VISPRSSGIQTDLDGTRTATVTVIDSAANSPQIVTMTATGTSVNGPTPVSIDTTGLTCTSGVCQLGFVGDQLVTNFYYTSFGALGDTAPPFTWSLVGGALPPGLTLFPSGQLYGTPTTTGLFTFTLKVTDPAGKTASQAFSQTVSPQPPPLTKGQQGCQHAPGSAVANLTGSPIGGQAPKGRGLGDQSRLTACGGFTVIHASVQKRQPAQRHRALGDPGRRADRLDRAERRVRHDGPVDVPEFVARAGTADFQRSPDRIPHRPARPLRRVHLVPSRRSTGLTALERVRRTIVKPTSVAPTAGVRR
jgi:hypothetical protein